jgi:hypothetical protein
MAASHKFKPLKERMANMKVKKVEIERLTVTSSKPFEAVVAALKAAVGQPDIAEFIKETRGARTFSDLERAVQKGLSPTGLMLFMELDQAGFFVKRPGALSRKSCAF